jgi:hypothetical protein
MTEVKIKEYFDKMVGRFRKYYLFSFRLYTVNPISSLARSFDKIVESEAPAHRARLPGKEAVFILRP